MMTFRIKYSAILWALMLLSCVREQPEPVATEVTPENVTSVVHYRAIAGEGPVTRASINNMNQYVFESGDQLYIKDKQGNGSGMYGILNLVAGAGSTTGTFEGDLMCLDGFNPTDQTLVVATLVSKDDKIHKTSSGKIQETNYNFNDNPVKYAASFADAIRFFSDFTAENSYGNHAFALSQNSSFLILSVTFDNTEKTTIGSDDTVTATIYNNGSEVLRTGSVDVEEIDFSLQANFVAAFPAFTLNNAAVSFDTAGGTPITTFNDIATSGSVSLQANKYYEISRSHQVLDFFTIQAKEDGTTITFKFTGNGIQYKKVGDANWTDYNAVSGITLDTEEYIEFRGKKTQYSSLLFETTKPCFIYGDIMSLCCESSGDYVRRTSLASNSAFKNAFLNANKIDIPAGRPLKLSATTLTNNCYESMFKGCTSLTHAPELPATNIPYAAYTSMFNGCTSLIAAPELPATSVGTRGYQYMFYGCTSLTTAPATIAGASGKEACQFMFYGCTSLANAPALTSNTVGENGYYKMFMGCTSLVQSPQLPATTIGSKCYLQMFEGCSSLVSGPSQLPATTLADGCYMNMFRNCRSLTSAPAQLPATSAADSCYMNMFNGCISLNEAPVLKLQIVGEKSCRSMFSGCTSLVTATGLNNITSVDINSCREMFKDCGELITTPDTLKSTTLPAFAYQEMYSGCAKITRAPYIKATTVNEASCYRMFYGCRRLREAPSKLDVEEVANSAFKEMFSGCASIPAAPDLSAMETVGQEGCSGMFYGCTNLLSVAELPATNLASLAYYAMFQESALSVAPSLPASTLATGCYQNMMRDCKYLEGPVLLPAATLVQDCYRDMFNGASRLNSVVCLATDHSAQDCTTDWLKDVSSTGTFVRPVGVVWATDDDDAIPVGWSYQNTGIDPIFSDDGAFDDEEDL